MSQEWALNTVLALNSGSWWWSVVTFWTLITGKTIAHSHFHVILVWHKAKPNNDNIISLCFSQIIMKFNCNNLFSNWPLLEAREACINIISANIWNVKQHLNLLNLNLQWHDYHLVFMDQACLSSYNSEVPASKVSQIIGEKALSGWIVFGYFTRTSLKHCHKEPKLNVPP